MLTLLIAPAVGLLCMGLISGLAANRHAGAMTRSTLILTALQLLAAVGAGICVVLTGGWASHLDVTSITQGSAGALAVLLREFVIEFNPTSVTMLLLVSFVSWAIARYSVRYLDGDANQGRYFRWLSLTAGAVCLMAVSGSLLLFGIAWAMSSLGIHRLLLHFPDRLGARQAAWTKFAVSRSGDAAMLIAIVALWSQFGTTRFSELSTAGGMNAGVVIAGLLCLAACLKSAQFPFHTWLPQTVETPTPVSALMHAGVVNAGGYLLIRTSPFLTQYSQPLQVLALVGAATVLVGGTVMMTQSSIKRSLAYSTVAQMGFMILQCGIGAFSAAFLHIIAHSLYKAYAFLASGSVISESRGLLAKSVENTDQESSPPWPAFAASAAITVCFFALSLSLFGLSPSSKAGGWVLSSVICLALVSGVWRAVRSGSRQAVAASVGWSCALSVVYAGCYVLAERLVSPGSEVVTPVIITASVITVFVLLFCLQTFTEYSSFARTHPWFARLYVHAVNGFYLESAWKRLLRLTATA